MGRVKRLITLVGAASCLVGCLPEYDPFTHADASDDEEEQVECPAPPANVIEELGTDPPIVETDTDYDRRGGLDDRGDQGVIHHEAYTSRIPFSMLSFQDFRGELQSDRPVDRGAGTVVDISEFWDDPDAAAYLDCPVCVLWLEDCPYDSLGACEAQYLAVSGKVTFNEFVKESTGWNQDGVDVLDVTLGGPDPDDWIVFRAVEIDNLFGTMQVCTGPDTVEFTLRHYSFRWVDPDWE